MNQTIDLSLYAASAVKDLSSCRESIDSPMLKWPGKPNGEQAAIRKHGDVRTMVEAEAIAPIVKIFRGVVKHGGASHHLRLRTRD